MAEVKYTISRTDIENTPKMFIYSKLDLYHTVRIDEDIRISGINVLSAYDGTSFYEDYNVSNIVSKVKIE